MMRIWVPSALVLLVFGTLSCGSGGGRQLQSITISQTTSGQEIQFVATGRFSAPPTTVSPLPADWGIGPFAPPPANLQYQLTTQPFVFQCTGSGPYQPITVFAPSNPNAPSSGSTAFKKVVTASAPPNCS